MARSMVDGATSSLTLAIGPATRTRAGVLTAEDYIRIQGIGETNDELTDTVLEMQDIIDQHTARLNAIGAAGNVARRAMCHNWLLLAFIALRARK